MAFGIFCEIGKTFFPQIPPTIGDPSEQDRLEMQALLGAIQPTLDAGLETETEFQEFQHTIPNWRLVIAPPEREVRFLISCHVQKRIWGRNSDILSNGVVVSGVGKFGISYCFTSCLRHVQKHTRGWARNSDIFSDGPSSGFPQKFGNHIRTPFSKAHGF